MSTEPIYVTRPTMAPLADYVAELEDIWDARFLTNSGPKHQKLAGQLSEYLGVEQVGLYANGHLALESALQALEISGEVITTPYTFASTTHAIVRSGAEPVFCDIDPTTYCMDPESIEGLITERTTAILPVHVYGNLCDSDAIDDIAEVVRAIERGKLKIRVRALEAERAIERVAVMQDVMLKAMVACAAINVGVVMYVSGMLIQAKAAFGVSAAIGLQAIMAQGKLSKLVKKEASYSGSA